MPPREGKPKRAHRKVCSFCVEKAQYIDYKEVSRLRRFISERGKILPGGSPAPAPGTSGR